MHGKLQHCAQQAGGIERTYTAHAQAYEKRMAASQNLSLQRATIRTWDIDDAFRHAVVRADEAAPLVRRLLTELTARPSSSTALPFLSILLRTGQHPITIRMAGFKVCPAHSTAYMLTVQASVFASHLDLRVAAKDKSSPALLSCLVRDLHALLDDATK
jgi:hypothetical protein